MLASTSRRAPEVLRQQACFRRSVLGRMSEAGLAVSGLGIAMDDSVAIFVLVVLLTVVTAAVVNSPAHAQTGKQVILGNAISCDALNRTPSHIHICDR
jgi:hypothetical protein